MHMCAQMEARSTHTYTHILTCMSRSAHVCLKQYLHTRTHLCVYMAHTHAGTPMLVNQYRQLYVTVVNYVSAGIFEVSARDCQFITPENETSSNLACQRGNNMPDKFIYHCFFNGPKDSLISGERKCTPTSKAVLSFR